jgi:hypothetical protein
MRWACWCRAASARRPPAVTWAPTSSKASTSTTSSSPTSYQVSEREAHDPMMARAALAPEPA